MLEEGANLIIHDPKVDKNQIEIDLGIQENSFKVKNDLPINQLKIDHKWEFSNNIDDALKDADAAVIITNWDEYKNLNWQKLYRSMRKPAWIFDTRSTIKNNDLDNIGINIWQIGT